MTLPIVIAPSNGRFTASLAGSPEICAEEDTRDEALAALHHEISTRIGRGELVEVEFPRIGVSDLAGRYRDDPSLLEICDAAYRDRDADRPQ